jgi:light-harvesting complex 1 beta chain
MSDTQLTEDEAKEFHSGFMMSFAGYVIIALIAHILVWMWRPWLAGSDGSAALIDKAQDVASAIIPFVA